MPLSAAERVRYYGAKLKESNDQYEAIKENDCKKKAKKIWDDKITAWETELLIKRLWKSIKQIKKDKTTSTTPIKVLKTPQSLGKAKNKVKKHLPQSLRHKKELILWVSEEFGIKVSNNTNANKSVSEDIMKKKKKHYLENSWPCPGKKDVVIVREKLSPK